MKQTYATPEEAAKLCKVTRRTIYKWIDMGILPATKRSPKLGKSPWYILITDIPTFLRKI